MGNEFTKLAARHTVGYSAGIGAFLTLVMIALLRIPLVPSVVAGILFGLFNWVIWRKGGIGRRIEKNIPEGPVDSKKILLNLAIGGVIFALVFGWILLTGR